MRLKALGTGHQRFEAEADAEITACILGRKAECTDDKGLNLAMATDKASRDICREIC